MPTFAYILYDILLSLLAVRWLNVGQLLEIKLWCCHLTFSHIFKSNMKSCYTKETWKKFRRRLMCVMCIGNHLYKVFFSGSSTIYMLWRRRRSSIPFRYTVLQYLGPFISTVLWYDLLFCIKIRKIINDPFHTIFPICPPPKRLSSELNNLY